VCGGVWNLLSDSFDNDIGVGRCRAPIASATRATLRLRSTVSTLGRKTNRGESDSDDEEADLDTIDGLARAAVGDAQAAASSASAAADAARRLLVEAQNGDVDADGIGRLTDATNVAFAAATAAARAASRAAAANAADAETADAAAFDAANAAAQALQALDAARVVLGMCTPGPSNDVRAADLAARFLVHDRDASLSSRAMVATSPISLERNLVSADRSGALGFCAAR
jgi:hypothetical protein